MAIEQIVRQALDTGLISRDEDELINQAYWTEEYSSDVEKFWVRRLIRSIAQGKVLQDESKTPRERLEIEPMARRVLSTGLISRDEDEWINSKYWTEDYTCDVEKFWVKRLIQGIAKGKVVRVENYSNVIVGKFGLHLRSLPPAN